MLSKHLLVPHYWIFYEEMFDFVNCLFDIFRNESYRSFERNRSHVTILIARCGVQRCNVSTLVCFEVIFVPTSTISDPKIGTPG